MYKIVLILICILVVYAIFAFQNPFNNASRTAIRGVIAVLVGWLCVILISYLINNTELSSVSTSSSQIHALEEENSARMMGALYFGWAYPLIFIELVWGVTYLLKYYKKKNFLNLKFNKS